MALGAFRGGRAARGLAVAAFAACLGLTGCNKSTGEAAQQAAPNQSAAAESQIQAEGDAARLPRDAQHQAFADATRQGDNPPEGAERPPDTTCTGKSVAKLYAEVVRLWDTIRFADSAGKHFAYTATLETDRGEIEIALRPDVAPNHVRNFIALARAGYFDGLKFDTVEYNETNDKSLPPVELLEAGSTQGKGDPGDDSIGYWVRSEADKGGTPRLPHEEGTVGACHGTEEDSAGCRFYISLNKAPNLDGTFTTFGKVTRGLDVARTIFMQPVVESNDDPAGTGYPRTPTVIRRVTIRASQTDSGTGG